MAETAARPRPRGRPLSTPAATDALHGVTLEQYAGILAALADAHPLDAALANEALTAAGWKRADRAWKIKIAQELRQGQREQRRPAGRSPDAGGGADPAHYEGQGGQWSLLLSRLDRHLEAAREARVSMNATRRAGILAAALAGCSPAPPPHQPAPPPPVVSAPSAPAPAGQRRRYRHRRGGRVYAPGEPVLSGADRTVVGSNLSSVERRHRDAGVDRVADRGSRGRFVRPPSGAQQWCPGQTPGQRHEVDGTLPRRALVRLRVRRVRPARRRSRGSLSLPEDALAEGRPRSPGPQLHRALGGAGGLPARAGLRWPPDLRTLHLEGRGARRRLPGTHAQAPGAQARRRQGARTLASTRWPGARRATCTSSTR